MNQQIAKDIRRTMAVMGLDWRKMKSTYKRMKKMYKEGKRDNA